MSTESIPCCVLQLYVWLINPEKAGRYALLSIAIATMTTGFISATIAYDMVSIKIKCVEAKLYLRQLVTQNGANNHKHRILTCHIESGNQSFMGSSPTIMSRERIVWS